MVRRLSLGRGAVSSEALGEVALWAPRAPLVSARPALALGPAHLRATFALTSQAPPFSSLLSPMSSEELEEAHAPNGRGSKEPVVNPGAWDETGGACVADDRQWGRPRDQLAGGASSRKADRVAVGTSALRAEAPVWCPANVIAIRREDMEEDVPANLPLTHSPCPHIATWLDNVARHGGACLGPAFSAVGGGASATGHEGSAAVLAS